MTYSLWICCLIIKLKSYSQGISILLLFLNIFDLVRGLNYKNLNSQGYEIEFLRIKSVESKNDFCNYKNLERLLNFTSDKNKSSSKLSSNHKPSNQNSSSSTTTILLPQGNESIKQTPRFPQIQRIDSDEKCLIHPLAGCINLANYNWKYNSTINETERLSGVQSFIFHLYNGHADQSINVDLKILLYSTQEIALNRPIVIVLSSFLPRKFSLSAISYLSHSQQPLHIILTNSKSEVVIKDDQLSNKDLNKLFISTINLETAKFFPYEGMKKDEFIETVHRQLLNTSLFRYGYFFGLDINAVSQSRNNQKLWLFNNEQWFSIHKPDIRIATVYLVNVTVNSIDLIIGKPVELENQNNKDVLTNKCQTINALSDIIKTYLKFEYEIDIFHTCYYEVKFSLPPISRKFQTITWLHIESVPNISLNIEFISSRIMNFNSDVYLVILTGNQIINSTIRLSSLFRNRVHILTNISLNQFDREFWGDSSLLNLKLIGNSNDGSFQKRTITNYISAGSSAIMQTTIYSFTTANPIFEIRINVDDSKPISELNHSCLNNFPFGNSISISLNLSKWKLIDKWAESEFQLGDSSCIFRKTINKMIQITRKATQCSSTYNNIEYSNKIYGIWKNKKYLLKVVNFSCKNNWTKKNKTINNVTTMKRNSIYIRKDENGISIFNDSRFKSSPEKPFYDKMRVYIQVVYLQKPYSFELRSCYLSNQKAKIDDFKSTHKTDDSFKKVAIVHEGCLNKSSRWYSYIDKSLRPNELRKYNSSNMLYHFSIAIDADNWASQLFLKKQWVNEDKYQVHLYCGISVCHKKFSTPLCRSKEEQCTKILTDINSEIKYYGTFVIARKYENVSLKIIVLISLIVIIILLLLSLIFCLRQSYKQRHIQLETIDKSPDQEQTIDPEISFSSPRKRSVNLDYHSLTLLTKPNKKYSAKLYSEPKLFDSLKRLVENCDKSVYLNAGYLTSPPNADNFQLLVSAVNPMCATKKLRVKSHSFSENSFTEPTHTNWVINSWPLSTAERKYKSQGRNNPHQYNFPLSNINKMKSYQPNSSWHPATNSSGGSSKQKISCTFNSELKSISNPKVSSNRTTVSESMSDNDIPSKSSKWWSLLTNYWMNQSFVLSRN